MTGNEKLARWQGWELDDSDEMCHIWMTPDHRMKRRVPDYLNDDSAAMSLLDTLVEKDYMVELNCDKDGARVTIRKWDQGIKRIAFPCTLMDTRRAAVVAACLELIGKEDV